MKLTVFTPTYNRAHLLDKLFSSLQKQTCYDFEWLIIDDGSTDETSSVVSAFQETARFPVRFYRKENGGKHTAYNAALSEANGDWLVCVDSDDQLACNAVSCIIREMEKTPDIKGTMAYKVDQKGELLGNRFPINVDSMYLYELGIKYRCTGDYLFALDTKVAKAHPFPEFLGEKFLPESVMWDGLDKSCRFSVVREGLMICEYQQDGYTQRYSSLMKQNPSGFCLYFLQRIDLQLSMKQRLIHAGKYWCFRWISKNRNLKYRGKHRAPVFLAAIPGVVFRIYYKLIRHI